MKTKCIVLFFALAVPVLAQGPPPASTNLISWTIPNFPTGTLESPSVTNKPFLPVWDGEQWSPNFYGTYLVGLPASSVVGTLTNPVTTTGILTVGANNGIYAAPNYLRVGETNGTVLPGTAVVTTGNTNSIWLVGNGGNITNGGTITAGKTVTAPDFVGTIHGSGASLSNLNAAALSGTITNLPTLTNNWYGTFTGSVARATVVQADTLLAATFNAGTLNATQVTVSGVSPLTKTQTLYTANEAGDGVITNTIVISNGFIMSWSP